MHKPQSQLTSQLKRAKERVAVGGFYYHYKDPNNRYKVIHLAVMEADDKICVIYQAQYGDKLIFVRPLASWLAQVEWQGQTMQRFTSKN